jgi:hypothetical protein
MRGEEHGKELYFPAPASRESQEQSGRSSVKRASERVVRAAPTFRQHARRGGSVFGRSLVSSSRLSGFHLFWYSCLGRCCSLLSSVFWLFVKHDRDILRWMQRRAVPPADTAPNGSFFCSWILFPASLDLVQLRLGACTTSSRPACSWVQLVGLVNLLPRRRVGA